MKLRDKGRPPEDSACARHLPWTNSGTLLIATALVVGILLVGCAGISNASSTSARQDQQLFDVDAAKQWKDDGYVLPQGMVRSVRVPGSLGVKYPKGKTVNVLYPPPATLAPTWYGLYRYGLCSLWSI